MYVECWMFLPLAFFALSLSAQTSPTNLLPPLAPAYGEIRPTFWEQHGTAVLIVGFVFIALAGLAFALLSRPQPPVMVPPEVLAREKLAGWLQEPENGKLLSEISQTLRRYIVAAFMLPGRELTTVEFSAMLADSQKVGRELAQAVAVFLRECDQRKFSPAGQSTPLNAASRALEIVDQAEKQRVKSGLQVQTR